MGTFIILLFLAIIVCFAARQSIRQLLGRGGCCGGGSCHAVKTVKKKLNSDATKEIKLEVEGMNCRNCQNKIENSLNQQKGVVAKADYHTGKVKIKYIDDIANETLKHLIKAEGYKVIKIER